ncbi:hypothetical protein SAMN06266982_1188 [Propioniciclava tarda]|nr:hypothetical protein SAMN06266982_1188 [Propioniciclava tarda]
MALIKANADAGKTHLDNFTPFVLEAMRPEPSRSFQPHEIGAAVSEMMGIELPTRVAEALLKRLARQRDVVRDNREYRLEEGVAQRLPNLLAKQAAFVRDQEALIDKLIAFAAGEHQTVLDREAAAAALYAQIEDDTVDLLRVAVRADPYRRRALSDDTSYVVSDFIANVARADPQGYDAIVAAAKGTMLAAAIQIPNLERIESKFVNTTLYLDSPLLLQLVGLEGPEAQSAVSEVLRVARTAGAKVACFEHSVDEAEGVIRANAEARRRPGKVPTRITGIQAWAIKSNLDHHDLLIESEKFRSKVSHQAITVEERPDHIPRIEVSEDGLREALESAIAYRTDEPLLRDLDSLVAIHNLRRGSSSAAIESCRAVLITDNDAVARVARSFFSREGHQWPVATSMSDLATILYLKTPQEASTLPSLLLVAEAFAGLEPGSALWTRFLKIVEGQAEKGDVTAEDIALLCHSEESRRFLMEATLGRADKVSDESVSEILERAKQYASAPARADAALDAVKRKVAEEQRDATNERLSRTEQEVEGLKSGVLDANLRAKRLEENIQEVALNIRKEAVARANRRAKAVASLVSVALLGAGVASFAGWVPDGLLGTTLKVLTFAGGILGLVTAVMGGNLVAWLHMVRDPLANQIERSHRRRLGLPSVARGKAKGSAPTPHVDQ